MVAKKRCDFCLKIKPDNLQSDQKILNKDLEKILLNISGVTVSSEQLSNILTCFDCAISLIQAEPYAVKARNLLTKLLKQKVKKPRKGPLANGAADASHEQSTNFENDEPGEESLLNQSPKKITARRKSVANNKQTKAKNDTVLNDDGLDGSPAASSTMTVISTTPAAEKNKPKVTKSPKKIAKPAAKNDADIPGSTASKTGKRKISTSEQTNNNNTQIESSFKVSKTPNKKQRAESGGDDDEGEQSQQNGEVGECMECGKRFYHKERYDAHVLGQKCKNATFECRDPNCLRRFFKLKKMHEHLQRKHPDLLENESLDG